MFHGATTGLARAGSRVSGGVTAAPLFAVGRDPSPTEAAHGSRLPGIGARFVAGVAAEAEREGWGQTELAGLVAAAEERSALWLVTPAPGRRRAPEIRRWQSVRFVRSDKDPRVAGADRVGGAGTQRVRGGNFGLSRRADVITAKLALVGARVGRVDVGVADALDVGWAVELMIAPRLTRDALGSLREVMASAPRCGWCGVPVLGNRCRRCAGDA